MNREIVQRVLVGVRMRRGLSQNKAAQMAGVSHSTVNRWETGQRFPLRNSLIRYLARIDASAADTELALRAAGMLDEEYEQPLDARLADLNTILRDEQISREDRRVLSAHIDVGLGYIRRGELVRS